MGVDVTECSQFEYGMLQPFLHKFDLEDEAHVSDSEFYESDDSIKGDRGVNTHQRVLQFLKQVRQSRGYDVDTTIPRSFGSPFRLIDEFKLKDEWYNDCVMKGLNFALDKINDESNKAVEKTYEFVEFKNIVEANTFMFLFTFTAKVHNTDVVKTLQAMVYVSLSDELELCEWMVKLLIDASTGENASTKKDAIVLGPHL